MSVLPITKETIRYGTMDAGATINAEDDTLLESLKGTAKKLSVKPVSVCARVCVCVAMCMFLCVRTCSLCCYVCECVY